MTPETPTKKVLRVIMNSICRDLMFTEDFSNGYLPSLDTQLRLTPEGITYQFFEKESNTPYITLETSSIAKQDNMQSLSQEVVRRLQRTDQKKTQKEEDMILDKFAHKIKTSGYSISQTRTVILAGIKHYKRKTQEAEQSGKSINRDLR